MSSATALRDAVASALTEAGFVNVRARVEEHIPDVSDSVSVEGDCPCGRGRSQFSYAYPKSRPPPALALRALVLEQAQKHIDQDKAEGRWQ